MDEHLKQAYHEVIYELLINSAAKSAQVLKKYAHLVDEDFVELLGEMCTMLEERNCPEDAAVIQQLYQQLQETESLDRWLSEYAPQPVAPKPTLSPEQQKEQAEQLFQLGTQHFRANEYVEAVQAWQQALPLYQDSGDIRGGINCLGKLGTLYQSLGQYQQAITVHQRALAFSKKIKYLRGEASALSSLGQVCTLLGQYDRAISCYHESLEIADKTNFRTAKVNGLNHLGQVHYVLGEYDQALDYHQQALKLAKQYDLSFAHAHSINNIAHTYGALNQFDPAIKFYRQALKQFQEGNNPFPEANCHRNLGKIYQRKGKPKQAFNAIQAYLKIAKELDYQLAEANGLLDLAEIEISQEKYEEAIDHCHQTLEIQKTIEDLQGQTKSLNCLGKIYQRLERSQEAVDAFQQSLNLATPQLLPQKYLTAARQLGDLALSLNDWELATQAYQQVLPVLEQQNRSGIPVPQANEVHKTARQIYSQLIQIYIQQQQLEAAVEIVERFRCYQFVHKMSSHSFKLEEELAEDLALYQRLQRQHDALHIRRQSDEMKPLTTVGLRLSSRAGLQTEETALRILATETDKVWKRLQEANPILAAHLRVVPLNYSEIQGLIPNPETAILSLFSSEKDTYIFIISSDKIALHCCEGEGIETLQNWLEEQWVKPYQENPLSWRNQMNQVLLQLAQRLQISQWVAESLETIQELIIIPDLNLHLIPFAALPVPKDNQPEYLSDQFQLRMIQNCQILSFCSSQETIDSPHFGLIEDSTGNDILSSYECEKIAQICSAQDSQQLKSQQVIASQYETFIQQFQHLFISHPVQFNLQHPWQSQWQLLDESLTLEQVLMLDWSQGSELFFAQGQRQLTSTLLTDSYLHPSSELLCHGSQTVISSLWKMEPIARTIFSLLYYQNRQTLSAVSALQASQIQLRNLTENDFKNHYQQELESFIANHLTEENQQTINDLRTSLALLSKKYYPFAEPYYWAGYTLEG